MQLKVLKRPGAAEISVGPQSMLCIITDESRPGLASILPQMKPVPRTPPWKRVALLPLSGLRGHASELRWSVSSPNW